jgi:death-on-curing protein
MPRFLTLSETLLVLQDQLRRYGGEYGIRNLGLLSPAIAMPLASYAGSYLNKTFFDQAAAYAFHICQNHPFVDGNKRGALASALYDLMMSVAAGATDKPEIADTLDRLSQCSI